MAGIGPSRDSPDRSRREVRAAVPDPWIGAAMTLTDVPLDQSIATLMRGYADRPAVRTRALEFIADATGHTRGRLLPWYDTMTYGELWRRSAAVAAAWHLDRDRYTRAGDVVAFLGFTSGDYTVIDLACTTLGAVVPLQAGATTAQLAPIIAETQPRILAASVEYLHTAVNLALSADSVRSLIVFDHHPEDDDHRAAVSSARARLAGSLVVTELLAEVVERGARLPSAPLHAGVDENALAMLVYTSGSTGTPKGAMYPERLVDRMWAHRAGLALPPIGLSFMPVSHVVGRMEVLSCLVRGGTMYFAARSDMSTLFEDLALARPTTMFFGLTSSSIVDT